jgi:hypothetical protein
VKEHNPLKRLSDIGWRKRVLFIVITVHCAVMCGCSRADVPIVVVKRTCSFVPRRSIEEVVAKAKRSSLPRPSVSVHGQEWWWQVGFDDKARWKRTKKLRDEPCVWAIRYVYRGDDKGGDILNEVVFVSDNTGRLLTVMPP